MQNELDLQKAMANDQLVKLQQEVRDQKLELQKERSDLEARLRSGEVERAELVAESTALKEQLDRVTLDMREQETEFND